MGEFPGPHEPWDTPHPWAGMHQKEKLPPASPRPDWICRQPLLSECRQRELQWKNAPSNEAIATLRADYADHLALLDSQLGLLLENLPEPENTAITIASDHGELLGDAGFLYKSCLLEGAVRSLALHHRPCSWGRRRRWVKPVGLSLFLSEVAAEISGRRQLSTRSLPRFAISEFGKELLVTDRHRKLVMDFSGKILWATDLKRDPNEQTNVNEIDADISNSWHELRDAGLEHIEKVN